MHNKEQRSPAHPVPAILMKKAYEKIKILQARVRELEGHLRRKTEQAADLENVRNTIITRTSKDEQRLVDLRRELACTRENWRVDRAELARMLNKDAPDNQVPNLDVFLMNLRNSGAFSPQPDFVLDWKTISDERMGEIRRKEQVIQNKDGKASRLIDIIRGKNSHIRNLVEKMQKLQAEINYMAGSLGMVSEVVNHKATLVYHPQAAEASIPQSGFDTPPGQSPPCAPRSVNKEGRSWDDWIAARFSKHT